MSAYNPPDKNTSIFNPTNYSNAISTLADSTFDEVSASLGTFTSLFIGTDNVATSINSKHILLPATEIESFSITSNLNLINPSNTNEYEVLSYSTFNDLKDQRVYRYFTTASGTGVFSGASSNSSTLFEYTFSGVTLPTFDDTIETLAFEFDTSLEKPLMTSSGTGDYTLNIIATSSLDSYGGNLQHKTISYNVSSTIQKGSDRFLIVVELTAPPIFWINEVVFLLTAQGSSEISLTSGALKGTLSVWKHTI